VELLLNALQRLDSFAAQLLAVSPFSFLRFSSAEPAFLFHLGTHGIRARLLSGEQ
jgi:hypothetical protein